MKMQKNATKDNGFSLVELIVVIAIMAVLVAVLAPALLQYVERSRAQKDDSAMGEVTNAIQLALADQNAYDEALKYVISGKNGTWAPSCYCDSDSPDDTKNKVSTKEPDQYIYSDAERKADEVSYVLKGQMRGLTITFAPSSVKSGSKKMEFKLSDGLVNSSDTKLSEINAESADDASKGQIYNKLRAAIGDTVSVTSQTYRNSPYTVFIRMGTTGGNASEAQDAIKVYGQWGGTNLNSVPAVNGGGESSGGSGDQGGGDAPADPIQQNSFSYDGSFTANEIANGAFGSVASVTPSIDGLEDGKTYNITVNGTTYQAVCHATDALGWQGELPVSCLCLGDCYGFADKNYFHSSFGDAANGCPILIYANLNSTPEMIAASGIEPGSTLAQFYDQNEGASYTIHIEEANP